MFHKIHKKAKTIFQIIIFSLLLFGKLLKKQIANHLNVLKYNILWQLKNY